jgi:molybdopterin-guanine dinucleotide biosynthesis protein B
VIKHCHHALELDRPGKDSHRLRNAGASEMMVVSPSGWGVFADVAATEELTLEQQLSHLSPVDLVLLEGQKTLPVPKLEVYRAALGKPPRFTEDPLVIALASDSAPATQLPCLDLNDVEAIADFVVAWART